MVIADTPGNKSIKTITSGIMKGLAGAFVVFDISDSATFKQQQDWIELISMNTTNPKMVVILVGNKTDINSRQVSEDEA